MATAIHRARPLTLWSRIMGAANIERMLATGVRARIQANEVVTATVVLWWGIVLLPGWPPAAEPTLRVLEALDAVMSSIALPGNFVTTLPLTLGIVLTSGIASAWLGLTQPHNDARAWLNLAAAGFLMLLGVALCATGSPLGGGVYLILSVSAVGTFRRALTMSED